MFAPRPADPIRPRRLPGPVGAVLGLPAGVAAAVLTWLLGGSPTLGLVLTAAAAAWLGSRTTPLAALVAAALSWASYDGFVLHRFGVLEAGSPDLVALVIVAAAALGACTIGAVAARDRVPVPRGGYPALRMSGAAPSAGTVAE